MVDNVLSIFAIKILGCPVSSRTKETRPVREIQ